MNWLSEPIYGFFSLTTLSTLATYSYFLFMHYESLNHLSVPIYYLTVNEVNSWTWLNWSFSGTWTEWKKGKESNQDEDEFTVRKD